MILYMEGGGKMSGKKEQLSEIPVVFRVEQSVHDLIEEVMIDRREFNKSKITREIFQLGLEIFKKNLKK
jgi:hypothetical protein